MGSVEGRNGALHNGHLSLKASVGERVANGRGLGAIVAKNAIMMIKKLDKKSTWSYKRFSHEDNERR